MDQRGWAFLTLIVAAMLACTACLPAISSITAQALEGSGPADRVELLYFHRTERCQSCNNAELYARETLEKYFPDEVKCGKLSIQSIDYQRDKAMAEKYNVKMQGLKLKITRDGRETIRDVPEVWAFVKDKEACISCLKAALDKELGN